MRPVALSFVGKVPIIVGNIIAELVAFGLMNSKTCTVIIRNVTDLASVLGMAGRGVVGTQETITHACSNIFLHHIPCTA